MIHSLTVPPAVAQGIAQRLRQIEELQTTIGLMVQIAAEFRGLTGPMTFLGVEGDTLRVEVPDGDAD